MTEIAESEFPALFAHTTRKDWGVGVLAGVRDGKRTYLFEGGEERIMGTGSLDMMRKLSSLNPEQQETLARLTALVARRTGTPDASKAAGVLLLEQFAKLRRTFAGGFGDPGWENEKRAARARESLVPKAKQLLSLQALDAHLKAQQFEALWGAAAEVMVASGWVPSNQVKPTPSVGLPLLCGAVRELLYGSATLEQRVDRFVVAYETAFREPPRWETASALLALVFPNEYVLVDLAAFRKQLKVLGSKGTLPQRPTGAGYSRCLNSARIVASKLTEQGEVPQDLLDLHDFIRFTLKTAPPAPRAKTAKAAKAPKAKAAAKVDDDESASDSEED
jgi:hypothetical protein